jgi:hypothetical protein
MTDYDENDWYGDRVTKLVPGLKSLTDDLSSMLLFDIL